MNPQAFNRYSYCLNNPLKYVDPSGNQFEGLLEKALKEAETNPDDPLSQQIIETVNFLKPKTWSYSSPYILINTVTFGSVVQLPGDDQMTAAGGMSWFLPIYLGTYVLSSINPSGGDLVDQQVMQIHVNTTYRPMTSTLYFSVILKSDSTNYIYDNIQVKAAYPNPGLRPATKGEVNLDHKGSIDMGAAITAPGSGIYLQYWLTYAGEINNMVSQSSLSRLTLSLYIYSNPWKTGRLPVTVNTYPNYLRFDLLSEEIYHE